MNIQFYTHPKQVNWDSYTAFFRHQPTTTVYHSPDWIEVLLTQDKGHTLCIAYNDNHDIVGMGFLLLQSYFCLKRTLVLHGLLLHPSHIEQLEDLEQAVFVYAKKRSLYIEYRHITNATPLAKLLAQKKYKGTSYLNYVFNLNLSIEELLQRLHKEKRHNINRAKNKGVSIQAIEQEIEIQESIALITATYQRKKIPFVEKKGLETSLLPLIQKKTAVALGAYVQNKLIGVRILLKDHHTTTDWYAGYNASYGLYQNDALVWHSLLWAKEQGCTSFNFGGAGQALKPYSVREFKKRFGGEEIQGFRYRKWGWPHI